MLKISAELLSPFQILLGIKYHRGVEVLDNDQRVNITEFQIGILLAYVCFTWYENGEEG